jgi:hypothetical protein
LNSASYAEFVGALVGNTSVTCDVKTVWSGSVDGIQRLTNQGNPAFENTTWLASGSLSSTGTPNLAAGTEMAYADAAMSDVFQDSTIFQTPAIDNSEVIGVIPFEWCRNAGSPASLSNMTSMLAQELLSVGSVPLQLWSGNANDAGTLVYVTGRNFDSGTRVTGFAESGFGAGSPPNQVQVLANAANIATNVSAYPAQTVLGVYFPLGESGYSSGGLVSGALNVYGTDSSTNTGDIGWIVGYLGVTDANNVTNGAPMTWNGVAYSPTAVENGQYTYWGYEHFNYNNNVSGNSLTVLTTLENDLYNAVVDPTPYGGLPLAKMTVGRSVEGSPVGYGRAF